MGRMVGACPSRADWIALKRRLAARDGATHPTNPKSKNDLPLDIAPFRDQPPTNKEKEFTSHVELRKPYVVKLAYGKCCVSQGAERERRALGRLSCASRRVLRTGTPGTW